MNTGIGRSDRIRTCGIDVPNVARYQLRHTPKCEKYSIFRSISVSGQTCGQTAFIESFAREQSAEKVNVYKGFRAFEKSRSESRLHAPKASALPLSQKAMRTHLDTWLIRIDNYIKKIFGCYPFQKNTDKMF